MASLSSVGFSIVIPVVIPVVVSIVVSIVISIVILSSSRTVERAVFTLKSGTEHTYHQDKLTEAYIHSMAEREMYGQAGE